MVPQTHSRSSLILSLISANVLLVILYVAGYIFLANFLLDHPLFIKPDQYRRLYDWDLPRHGREDIDGDDTPDLITFTGCAFLSTVSKIAIPPDQQCTAKNISPLQHTAPLVGQKYWDSTPTEHTIDQEFFSHFQPGHHAYLYQNEDQWFITLKENYLSPAQTFQVNESELLTNTPTPLNHQLQLTLWQVSELLMIPSLWFWLFITGV